MFTFNIHQKNLDFQLFLKKKKIQKPDAVTLGLYSCRTENRPPQFMPDSFTPWKALESA